MAEDDDRAQIAQNVTRLRTRAGLSQAGLADAMRAEGQEHWRQTTVSRIEHGTQALRASEIRALSKVLGNGVIGGTSLAATMRKVAAQVEDSVVRRDLDEARELIKRASEILDDLSLLFSQKEKESNGEH